MCSMKKVKFDAEPSALIQLGSNLYKNIYGVLVEYITNSYDADATEVHVKVDYNAKEISIIDDGIGMERDFLEDTFLKLGNNTRLKYGQQTAKERFRTGRKGLGKMACFGLFKAFHLTTIKNGQQSLFNVLFTPQDNQNATSYDVTLSENFEATEKPNGTEIILKNCVKNIPSLEQLADSIALRLNLMFETDSDSFCIYLCDVVDAEKKITLNAKYRREVIIRGDNRFEYEIPRDIDKLIRDDKVKSYILKKGIHGIIIARSKTVKFRDNKGIVLYARNKICQEATYLNLNPSNDFSLAHLYGELHVDFIDNEEQDNIGTDRTALNDTNTTQELLSHVENLIRQYIRAYKEDDEKRKKEKTNEALKTSAGVKVKEILDANQYPNEIVNFFMGKVSSDNKKNEEVLNLLKQILPKKSGFSVNNLNLQEPNLDISNHKAVSIAVYDKIIRHIQEKYHNNNDGTKLVSAVYGRNSQYITFNQKFVGLNQDIQRSLLDTLRELGLVIVALRNVIYHSPNLNFFSENLDEIITHYAYLGEYMYLLDSTIFK